MLRRPPVPSAFDPRIRSSVAMRRASCGGQSSPMRVAQSNFIRRTWVATAAAKAVVSSPSSYPEGSRILSKPPSSARITMLRQCSQLDWSWGSGTPRNPVVVVAQGRKPSDLTLLFCHGRGTPLAATSTLYQSVRVHLTRRAAAPSAIRSGCCEPIMGTIPDGWAISQLYAAIERLMPCAPQQHQERQPLRVHARSSDWQGGLPERRPGERQ